MVVEMLIGGGLVRLITTTPTTSVVSTRTVATTAAMPATAMACASASAYNQICELVEQIHRWWICTDPPTLLFFLVRFDNPNFLLKYTKERRDLI
jgi:hypothetical protein